MQTAKCLDYRRLGKQRVECLQVLKSLSGLSNGWKNHPATKMWQGYEKTLCEYARVICSEWINRGYKDTCLGKIEEIEFNHFQCGTNKNPPWLNEEFCKSHQSNLLRKNKEFYSKYNWDVPNDLPYVWPVR